MRQAGKNEMNRQDRIKEMQAAMKERQAGKSEMNAGKE